MHYEKLLKENLIKPQKPDFKQIAQQLKRAQKDIRAAESLLPVDLTWAFAIAYHAMMRAGRALMFAKGYLPTVTQPHKTIVEFTRLILGAEYEDIINRFGRMRRRRHDFIYDSQNHVTPHEAKSAIETARKLIAKITDIVKEENPAKEP